MSYKFTIKCTYKYYGYPQAERHYEISTPYLDSKITFYGNDGYDIPIITNKHHQCVGYFSSLRILLKDLFNSSSELCKLLRNIKEGDTAVIVLE